MARTRTRTACLLIGLLVSTALRADPQPAAPVRADGQPDTLLRMLVDRGWAPIDAAQGGARLARDAAADVVMSAMSFLDLAYRRGGTTAEAGFDCSGFVRHVVQGSLGLVLPRRSAEQARADDVQAIDPDELRPGDLVFFNTLRQAFSHVGIYVGEGRFIHSPRSGSSVRIEDMRKPYWMARFDGARRLAPVVAARSGEPPGPR
jgi:hypothetical protein